MMLLKPPAVSKIVLVRPGATDFDDQGRIKGSLDVPMSVQGRDQAKSLAQDLSPLPIRSVYSAPCQSALQTAALIAGPRDLKVKATEALRNVDHGLWHGKLIEEVRRNQPRAYRLGQDSPDAFCAPRGEPIHEARARVLKAIRKICRRGRDDLTALVVPEPMATVVESLLRQQPLDDLWKSETDRGQWQLIESRLV